MDQGIEGVRGWKKARGEWIWVVIGLRGEGIEDTRGVRGMRGQKGMRRSRDWKD